MSFVHERRRLRVVAASRQRRGVQLVVVIPRAARGQVADHAVAAVSGSPAPHLSGVRVREVPRVALHRVQRRVRRERLPAGKVRRRQGRGIARQRSGVRPRSLPRSTVGEVAHLDLVVAGNHAAGGLVVELLRREQRVGVNEQDAVLPELEDEVVQRHGGGREAVQRAVAGGDRERARRLAGAVSRREVAAEGVRLVRGDACAPLGEVMHEVRPSQHPSVAGIDDHLVADGVLPLQHD